MDPATGELISRSQDGEHVADTNERNDIIEIQQDFFETEVELPLDENNKNKRKSGVMQNASKKKPKQTKTLETDDPVIQLYAYKADLAIHDSLIKNNKIVLWRRDGSFLLEKFVRNGSTLTFSSTKHFRTWNDINESSFLPIAAVVKSKEHALVVEVANIPDIERQCLLGNFKKLNLEPLKSYAGNDENVPKEANEGKEEDDYLNVEYIDELLDVE